ncbi:unnamed protein product [Caenorhabditis auriculariae]|uniref:Uncharacterized protein n=1 Tax=Caenorhabditis auriculariae TaxID=2777116 RepID=A0A8S1GN90_9PELO|nr:unnamed protein product [Caenorhabditis auriculariae]
MASLEGLTKLRSLFSAPRVLSFTSNTPIAAYLLPSTDAHQSEYLSDYDFRVRFLSGFSGSNAYVVVTTTKALLWTDGRYFAQANRQLDANWKLMKQAVPEAISVVDWLIKELPANSYIGFDPSLHTFEGGKSLREKLKAAGLTLVPISGNLVDEFWADRPSLGNKQIVVLNESEHGKEVKVKVRDLRQSLEKKNCTAAVFTALDDIVWLLNIRGFDIKYNPLVYSYLLVTKSDVHLFIDENRISGDARGHFAESNVHIHKYEDATRFLTNWHKNLESSDGHRVFVPISANYAIGNIFGPNHTMVDVSPIQISKAVKNYVEMEGMRRSHVRDSAALVEFLCWLEKELLAGKQYSEIELAAKIDGLRANQEKFVDLSFSTISAVGSHASFPHYHPEGENGKRLASASDVYLVDSGAQYRDGTTDVTRTVWLKEPPAEFIKNNTLVLKGHIHLATTIFPDGIIGVRLDTLSRHALWQQGLDFQHGTGHGVGHFLNVHEGPIGIGFRSVASGGEIHPSQVLTIEPGYYLEEKYGIRIENCYETVKAENVPSKATNFVTFKALTLVPIQTDIIDKSLLTAAEIDWLNAYHDRVLAEVGQFLRSNEKENVLQWLQNACKHI